MVVDFPLNALMLINPSYKYLLRILSNFNSIIMSTTPNQPHLNGAYVYGPSIPPPTKKSKSYHRPGHGVGGGGCNPFSWCCSCLCGCIVNPVCQILITTLVILGIIVLVFWFIFRPNAPKFHVNDDTLTQFILSTNNSTLYYDLAMNMTFRNPSCRIGIYYDRFEANAEYHGKRFDSKDSKGPSVISIGRDE